MDARVNETPPVMGIQPDGLDAIDLAVIPTSPQNTPVESTPKHKENGKKEKGFVRMRKRWNNCLRRSNQWKKSIVAAFFYVQIFEFFRLCLFSQILSRIEKVVLNLAQAQWTSAQTYFKVRLTVVSYSDKNFSFK